MYLEAIFKKWLISAVARAYEAGCKADLVLIMEGKQGAKKSTFFETLASVNWFTDNLRDFDTKEASQALEGNWIIELGELSQFKRSEIEAQKAFISRRVEKYRKPYARYEIAVPRMCVFAGTTNRNDYLTDTTGNRRYLPCKVGEIDIEWVESNRDQLWAEAVHMYKEGSFWWFTDEDAPLFETIEEQQTARVELAEWAEALKNEYEYKDVALSSKVVQQLAKLIEPNIHSNRINKEMRKAGFYYYKNAVTFKDKTRSRAYTLANTMQPKDITLINDINDVDLLRDKSSIFYT